LKQEVDSICQLRKKHETMDHLTSDCPSLAKKKYLMRHDKICAHLHYSLCKALGIETTDRWYTHINTHTHTHTHKHTHTHTHKPICDDEDVAVLWNQGVHTDTEVTADRPDLIIKTKNREKHVYWYMRQYLRTDISRIRKQKTN